MSLKSLEKMLVEISLLLRRVGRFKLFNFQCFEVNDVLLAILCPNIQSSLPYRRGAKELPLACDSINFNKPNFG